MFSIRSVLSELSISVPQVHIEDSLLNEIDMRSMFSLFAYYLSSALIGLSPIRFADKECDPMVG